MYYRPEIDGLRAIAVVAVILFHAGFQKLTGGFVGVDIFFVISGYLITTILVNELDKTGRFSIPRFYERRARRILPAMALVLLACLPAAWLLMMPSQLEELGRNVAAVALFSSNFAFWLNTDYFAAATELNPLLHTWTLAVEEQFYIFFPLLLWALWRFGKRHCLAAIIVLTIASFGLAEWGWRNAPAANFYLLPFRAWELGAGSICAFLLRGKAPRANNYLALFGIALIIYSIFWYDADTPFPSAWALAPVAGTALVILFTTNSSVIGRVLSLRPMVWLGLVSYSAYLWHQPLFAFARIASIKAPSLTTMAILSVLSVALAYLTWRFVENPFRAHNRQPPKLLKGRPALFGASCAALVALGGIGAAAYAMDGLPQRVTGSGSSFAELDLDNRLKANYGLDKSCRRMKTTNKCRTGAAPRILLWGDSYAMHLGQALLHSPDKADFMQATMSGCGPFPSMSITGGAAFGPRFAKRCIRFNDQVMKYIQNNHFDLVIASSAMGVVQRRVQKRDGTMLPAGSSDAVIKNMRRTVRRVGATGAKLVWISPPPSTGEDLSKCPIKSLIRGVIDPQRCDIPLDQVQEANAEVDSVLAAASSFVPVFRLDELLCKGDHCPTFVENRIIFRDDGHITTEGSRFIGEKYNLMGRVMTFADMQSHSQRVEVKLPDNISLGDDFRVMQSRQFTNAKGELRQGMSFEIAGQTPAPAFSKIGEELVAAGYTPQGKLRRKEEQISRFFSKAGQPTLFVRSSTMPSKDEQTRSDVWISWVASPTVTAGSQDSVQ